MAVHFKFVSARDHATVKFDGGFITVADLKRAISAQKKLDRSADTDLLITNAMTREGPFGAASLRLCLRLRLPTPTPTPTPCTQTRRPLCTALRSLELTHVPDAFFGSDCCRVHG
jgi:hypothetical protein